MRAVTAALPGGPGLDAQPAAAIRSSEADTLFARRVMDGGPLAAFRVIDDFAIGGEGRTYSIAKRAERFQL